MEKILDKMKRQETMQIHQPAENLALPGVKKHYADEYSAQALHERRRLSGLSWLPDTPRNHLVASLGEFVGTLLFLSLAFAGTQVANTTKPHSAPEAPVPDLSVLLYIAFSFGFSLVVNAWVFFRITGGMFNPAVTLALCLIGAVDWIRGCLVVISQILAGIASAALIAALLPGVEPINTALGPGTSTVRGLFIETFLTAQLVFTIILMAAEKHKATFLAPLVIGLALFVAELSGVWFTGGSLNPARSFGPAVVLDNFPSYHWIYWLGPCLGAVIAVLFYKLVKALEYETCNPGQDSDTPMPKILP